MHGYMLDDIHLKGERSSVIANLKKEDLTGVATGAFKNPVEVMYIEAISDLEEQMDIQVFIFIYILSLFLE